MIHALRKSSQLSEGKRVFRSIFDDNTAVKLLIDPAAGRVVDANRAACEFYGYSYDELCGKPIWEINTCSESEVRQAMLACDTGDKRRFEFKHRLASGEIRDVEVHSAPTSLDGRTLLFSIVQDITEKRRLEERLAHAQRLEAMGRLAGGVAHDFNNFLAAFLGYGELILEDSEAGSRVHRHAEQLVRGVLRAQELTQQLLLFSRRQGFEPRRVDLNELVAETRALLSPLLGSGVRLVDHLSPDLGAIVADPGRLGQVIVNLAVNARDAMPTGGELRISTRNRWERGEAQVELEVSDTGVGMTPEVQSRIFEPFFTTKAPDQGTGLGLATVYGIVQQSGGTIEVRSQPGRGSSFFIRLPRAEGSRTVATDSLRVVDEEGPRSREIRRTVLLVEDQDELRETLRDTLEGLDCVVIEARDAIEALRLYDRAEAGTVDVLLTDLQMPEMSGLELYDVLTRRDPGLKTILMSGNLDEVARSRQGESGRLALLQKPFMRETLARELIELSGE